MLHLDLLISPHQSQLAYLAARYHAAGVGNEWQFANEVGRGVLRAYALPLELAVYTYELELVQPLVFDTLNPADSGVYCVFVNLGPVPISKTIDGDTVTLAKDMPGGIFFYSPGTTIAQQQAPGTYTFLCFTFTRETMRPLLAPGSAGGAYFEPGRMFHVFEEITLEMEQLLRPLVGGAAAPLDALTVYSRALSFWQLLVQQLARRQQAPPAARLLQPDVEHLFRARALLEAHYQQVPSIAALAREVGMSETKLTRYFPQYFGRTIYQHAQYVRMSKARELLLQGRQSVSEVGFEVGYNSLSHFTNAFRKHFGVLPKYLLQQVRRHGPVSGG